jgi:hypothetical protein
MSVAVAAAKIVALCGASLLLPVAAVASPAAGFAVRVGGHGGGAAAPRPRLSVSLRVRHQAAGAAVCRSGSCVVIMQAAKKGPAFQL